MEGVSEKDQHGIELLESVLRYYYRWAALVEDEGVYNLVVDGEEFHFFDVLKGIQALDPRECECIKVLYLDGFNVTMADQLLHYIKPAVSAKIYAQSGLVKLYYYSQGVRDGSTRTVETPDPHWAARQRPRTPRGRSRQDPC